MYGQDISCLAQFVDVHPTYLNSSQVMQFACTKKDKENLSRAQAVSCLRKKRDTKMPTDSKSLAASFQQLSLVETTSMANEYSSASNTFWLQYSTVTLFEPTACGIILQYNGNCSFPEQTSRTAHGGHMRVLEHINVATVR